MNRFLSANLRVWHLLVGLGAVVALGAGGVVMARPVSAPRVLELSGGVTPAVYATGTIRMASNISHDSVTIHEADGKKSVLSASFVVPSGQRADIVSFFSAEAYKYPKGYCYLEFHIDSLATTPLNPGELWVADGYIYDGGYPTISAQGVQGNVGAGTHILYVTLRATGGACYVDDRSLILLTNTHS
jgi:hypothetical protein